MGELFEGPKLSLDRMPVLRGVFERLASGCVERMRLLCVPPCAFTLDGVSAGNTWDLTKGFEDGICSVSYADAWDARLLIGFDRRFAFSIVEAMFGGDGSEAASGNGLPLSVVEVRIMNQIFELVTECLSKMLALIDGITLSLERIESHWDCSAIGISDAPAVMAQFITQVFDGGGRMFVIIPQAALLPFRQKLAWEQSTEPPRRDPVWAERLLSELGRAEVQLDAVLDGPCMSLGEIAKLHPKQLLRLPASPGSLLSLESMDQPLFHCRLGQSDGMFTVRIEHHVTPQQELIGEPDPRAQSNLPGV
jgi:flagellar motor switch protein FliM